MTKRRYTDFLPPIWQTPVNERFFAATVDEVFQPGSADQISGFIGQVPSYYDADKDFYLVEPSLKRAAYQLAPVMVSTDATGTPTELFGYDDLIHHLRESNAVVTDENRLFSDIQYTWMPPVDIDKLLNPQQYLWFGDDPSLIPTVTLHALHTDAIGDGTTVSYVLPATQGGVDPARERPVVLVDHVPAAFTVANGTVTLVAPPAPGSAVAIYRYGDLRAVISGLASFDPRPFLSDDIGVTALTSNMLLTFDDALAGYEGYDLLGFDASAEAQASGCPRYLDTPWDAPFRQRVADRFFAEGIGTEIVLVPAPSVATDYTAPMYVTIDRRSADRNPWSISNLWVHRDAVAFSGLDFKSRRGLRPIVEFRHNLELFDYGWRRLADVQATLSGNAVYIPTDRVRDPVNTGNVPGSIALPLTSLNGLPIGHVVVDAGHRLQVGDRLLVRGGLDTAIKDCIVEASLTRAASHASPEERDALAFRIVHRPEIGDIVALNPRGFLMYDTAVDGVAWDKQPWDYSGDPITYHYTAAGWVVSANADPLQDPLFALYTADGVAHEVLPDSTFSGNRLFGFAAGTGADDPVLRRALQYRTASTVSTDAEIVFSNDQAAVRASSAGTPIVGYQFYRVVGPHADADRYENGWFACPDRPAQTLSNGVFTIPANLFCNPDMAEIETTDRSQYFDQFVTLLRRQPGLTGSPFQRNNWRDTPRSATALFTASASWSGGATYAAGDVVQYGVGIYRCIKDHIASATFDATLWLLRPTPRVVQPRTPLLKTMLLASDARFDYQDAVRYADDQYQRFRNKFYAKITDVLNSGACRESDPDETWVETILKALRVAKSPDFPFALSTMAGGTYFIPPTAAAMGLMPVVTPGIQVDDLVSSAYVDVIGHDGSRTPYPPGIVARIMLALETRIWRNIPAKFRTDARPAFDFDTLIETRASRAIERTISPPDPCDTAQASLDVGTLLYATLEVARILMPMFLRWAQVNNYDYRTNSSYDPGNPFTWNFRGCLDRDGHSQRGGYRAIFRWFYDTDRPHVVPWEMLGFATKPSWWDAEYGVAPYTNGNLHLWQDLRDGCVRQGVRAGTWTRYARPDLFSIIPVDDGGDLLDPIVIGLIPTPPTAPNAARPWEFGDQGPIETIWLNSASYPFAKSILGYLLRPAEWIETGWDTLGYVTRADGQWLNIQTGDRPTAARLSVHGEISAETGLPTSVPGVQQWIVDLMTSRAQKPSLLGTAVRGLQVRLCHKMGAFTQDKSLRIYADNIGILPPEDTTVVLHTSPAFREVVYSGVVIEWTGVGWSVVGYDTKKNGFCTIPGKPTGPQHTIALGVDPLVFEWAPRREYTLNVLVNYLGSTYRCTQSHTSTGVFEPTFWTATPITISRLPKVTVYDEAEDSHVFVPYGTVFTSLQDVAEFLWDWSRALTTAGFVFDAIDPDSGSVQDWEFAIRQFLEWTTMDWKPGNFIALSPGASSLTFVADHGFVMDLSTPSNGLYPLLDRTGRPVGKRASFISRIDETTQILCSTNNLSLARLWVAEIEHALVFPNLTVFGDVIYQPLYSLRQPRLRLIGLKTRAWAGRLSAPGYMVDGNDLQANFDRAAENLRTMFDIERSEDVDLRDHARHVIGYQKRPYLDNLLISETQQFEFYQGMIQAKGSPSVFERLTRSKIVDDDVNLAFLEEWGFQIAQFGATDVRTRMSFRLDQTDLRGNPQFIFFGQNDPYDALVALPPGDARWVIQPQDVYNVFPVASETPGPTGEISPLTNPQVPALPTAGPVRIDEVDVTCFSPAYFDQLYAQSLSANPVRDGWTMWVYTMQAPDRGWDVLRAYKIGSSTCTLLTIETQAEDATLDLYVTRLIFAQPHGLTAGDTGRFLILDATTLTTPDLAGFSKIAFVESPTSVLINASLDAGIDLSQTSYPPNGYVMRSQRFATPMERDAFYFQFPMVDGQYCYVDQSSALQ